MVPGEAVQVLNTTFGALVSLVFDVYKRNVRMKQCKLSTIKSIFVLCFHGQLLRLVKS